MFNECLISMTELDPGHERIGLRWEEPLVSGGQKRLLPWEAIRLTSVVLKPKQSGLRLKRAVAHSHRVNPVVLTLGHNWKERMAAGRVGTHRFLGNGMTRDRGRTRAVNRGRPNSSASRRKSKVEVSGLWAKEGLKAGKPGIIACMRNTFPNFQSPRWQESGTGSNRISAPSL